MSTKSLHAETKRTILFSLIVLAIVVAFTMAVTSVDGAAASDVAPPGPLAVFAHVPCDCARINVVNTP